MNLVQIKIETHRTRTEGRIEVNGFLSALTGSVVVSIVSGIAHKIT